VPYELTDTWLVGKSQYEETAVHTRMNGSREKTSNGGAEYYNCSSLSKVATMENNALNFTEMAYDLTYDNT
jgi:hypothetical protein